MKSTTVRRTALSVAAVAALTSVAACGSSSGPGKGDKAAANGGTIHVSPIAAVLRTTEQSTDKAESAKVRSSTTLGTVMSLSATGEVSWAGGLKGDLTLTYTGGRLGEAMRKAGTPSSEARYLPDAVYGRVGGKFAEQTGKHWIRYSYADLTKITGGATPNLQDQARTTTPYQSVQMLLASHDVKKVGREDVSGVRVTHYSGTIDVADFARRNGNLSASRLAELKRQLDKTGITTETVDIWINDQNLLVKKTEKADTAYGAMTNTTYFSDYGVKVSPEAPPASDTKDFKDLMKSLGVPGSGRTSSGSGTSVPGAGSGISS
ncbi:hypothetical protein ACFV2N_14630 [Streptomyces sp. NPDC059680]|uniref:hypothetical protein n=1 Tax=Streptomyces sp. NPDC059680 TaxID=3346904 RepID=UPI0036A1DF9A